MDIEEDKGNKVIKEVAYINIIIIIVFIMVMRIKVVINIINFNNDDSLVVLNLVVN